MSRVGWGLRSGERLDLSGNKFYNAVAVENIVRKERERGREREERERVEEKEGDRGRGREREREREMER